MNQRIKICLSFFCFFVSVFFSFFLFFLKKERRKHTKKEAKKQIKQERGRQKQRNREKTKTNEFSLYCQTITNGNKYVTNVTNQLTQARNFLQLHFNFESTRKLAGTFISFILELHFSLSFLSPPFPPYLQHPRPLVHKLCLVFLLGTCNLTKSKLIRLGLGEKEVHRGRHHCQVEHIWRQGGRGRMLRSPTLSKTSNSIRSNHIAPVSFTCALSNTNKHTRIPQGISTQHCKNLLPRCSISL